MLVLFDNQKETTLGLHFHSSKHGTQIFPSQTKQEMNIRSFKCETLNNMSKKRLIRIKWCRTAIGVLRLIMWWIKVMKV